MSLEPANLVPCRRPVPTHLRVGPRWLTTTANVNVDAPSRKTPFQRVWFAPTAGAAYPEPPNRKRLTPMVPWPGLSNRPYSTSPAKCLMIAQQMPDHHPRPIWRHLRLALPVAVEGPLTICVTRRSGFSQGSEENWTTRPRYGLSSALAMLNACLTRRATRTCGMSVRRRSARDGMDSRC